MQPDFYFSIVMATKKIQKVVGHLMNNNTIMWFTYFSEVVILTVLYDTRVWPVNGSSGAPIRYGMIS